VTARHQLAADLVMLGKGSAAVAAWAAVEAAAAIGRRRR
jgi:uncharacterized protein (TIGR03382 family)